MLQNITLPLLLSFLAGISTVIGALVFLFFKNFHKSWLSFLLGVSGGSMVYISFVELLPEAIKGIGAIPSNITFFIGIVFIAIIDVAIPHHYRQYCCKKGIEYNKLMVTGLITAIGIAIHNFPEGVAVFMSSVGNPRFGLSVAFATALHNIPEGVAVATPIYFATKDKMKSLKYSFLAGIAEPIGAVVTYLVLRPCLSHTFLSYIFAFVAGIMVYISFDELIPSSFENCQGHNAISGIVVGMLIMALSLNIF